MRQQKWPDICVQVRITLGIVKSETAFSSMDSLGEYEHVTAKQVEDLDEIDEDGESKTSREKYLQVLDTETEVKTGTSAVWISYCGGEGEKYRQLKALLGQNTGKQAQSSA